MNNNKLKKKIRAIYGKLIWAELRLDFKKADKHQKELNHLNSELDKLNKKDEKQE